ncbi:MAG: type VII secretion protein EssC [Lachnospiraceae bacterium]|nr:type VII secretion protein EssC [Lachnospiraceae bacterium]
MKNQYVKYDKRVNCNGASLIIIGGQNSSTICVPSLGDTEVVLRNCNSIERKSSNTVITINGYPIDGDESTFSNKDFIGIDDILVYYCDGWLYFTSNLQLTTSFLTESIRESNNHLEYPQFYRSVRQLYEIPNEKMEVLQPKAPTEDNRQGLLATVLPAMISMVMMLMMRMSMGRNIFFIILCGGMMVVSAGLSISSYIKQGKQLKEKKENRLVKYGEYIEKTEKKIVDVRQKEMRLLNQKYPSITELVKMVEDFDSRLFERKKSDEDFLDCYIGIGKHDAISQVSFKKQDYVELEDPLMDIPEQMYDKYKFIENMPIILHLRRANAVGFIGVRNKLYQMIKNLILEVAISQYYEDVRMCLFMEEGDKEYLSWARWLQNFDEPTTGRRNIAYNEESSNKLLEVLYTIMSKRAESKSSKEGFDTHYVVFAYKTEKLYAHPIVDYIKRANELGFTFVLFEEYPEFMNPDCSSRIFLDENDNTGYIQSTSAGENVQHFSYTHVSSAKAEFVAKKLSCVYVEETSLESNLTKSITLYELLNISSADQLDLGSRWSGSRIYDSMAAPLGVKSGDEVVSLDIHEKYHGPHGLVAGTTGSGKSEILQSYILSMASLFHPYEVSFIIIDFKGGGMVNQFKNLPHLNGAITNIDGKQINRSLQSIKAELLKRQRLFAENEVNHIDDYIRKFKSGTVSEPLPHLILIIDEFAELKSEQPDFMKELISAARIGRSLGVHLILATQKPAGVVNDQIWSNSRFKLCLKVQTPSDSNEMLKSPLAAEIREPGRAYLQVGNNEIFELFQSGYSGAKISSNADEARAFTINLVGLDGSRKPLYVSDKQESDSDITQLDEMVQHIASYCESQNIEPLTGICLPPLEESVICDYSAFTPDEADMTVPIGIYDDPANHYQGPTSISLVNDNITIVGSAGTGKTNILLGIIKGITEYYTPEEVNIYILDFASLMLVGIQNLCYVSSVITSRDDEKLKTFFNTISEEIEARKDKLSDMGYGSFQSYRKAGKKDMPEIVIIVDNVVAFKEMYPECVDIMTVILRDGLSVGICVITTSAQASALGYRASSFFSKKIALSSNDNNIYSQLFDRNKLYPDNIPGRFITAIDKTVYEVQGYVPFDYSEDSTMLEVLTKFVSDVNSKHKSSGVQKMRSMPEVVNEEYINEIEYVHDDNKLLIGIEHVSLDVQEMSLYAKSVIGILNGVTGEETGYINYLMNIFASNPDKYRVHIADGIARRLAAWSEYDNVEYCNNPQGALDYIGTVYSVLKERYEKSMSGDASGSDDVLEVILINSSNMYDIIGNDMLGSSKFTKICNQYKGLGVLLILADLPNANIGFGMTPVIRGIKDNMDILLFRSAKDQKVVDMPSSMVSSAKKKTSNDDAYYVHSSEITRVRVPSRE